MEIPSGTGTAPAATSAPVSTPAATPSPTPSATPSATPAAPVSSTPTPAQPIAADDTRSTEQILAERMSKAFETPGESITPDPKAPEESADDLPNTDGEDGADAGNGENASEEANATAAETTAGTRELAAALESDPALKAALEANPALKGKIFANARAAERADKYDEIIGSPEEAQVVAEGNMNLSHISELIANVEPGNPKSLYATIDKMRELSALRDENGEVLKDAQGNIQTDGTVGRFLKEFVSDRFAIFEAQAKEAGDEEYQQALDTVMRRSGLREALTPSEDEVSDEVLAQKRELDDRKKEYDERDKTQRKQAEEAHDSQVNSRTASDLKTAVDEVLKTATGLTDFTKSKAVSDIYKALGAKLRTSPTYQSELRAINARPIGKAREDARVALAKRYTATYLAKVATPILAEAGAAVMSKQERDKAASDARAEAAKSESRGSISAVKAATSAPVTIQQIEQDLTAKLGRRPDTSELLAEKMARSSAASAR